MTGRSGVVPVGLLAMDEPVDVLVGSTHPLVKVTR